jgi:hypothetical protein
VESSVDMISGLRRHLAPPVPAPPRAHDGPIIIAQVSADVEGTNIVAWSNIGSLFLDVGPDDEVQPLATQLRPDLRSNVINRPPHSDVSFWAQRAARLPVRRLGKSDRSGKLPECQRIF